MWKDKLHGLNIIIFHIRLYLCNFVPFYIYLSMMSFKTFKQSMILLPLAIIGIYIGYRILKVIDEKLFYNIIYILILFSSSKLIYDYIIKFM